MLMLIQLTFFELNVELRSVKELKFTNTYLCYIDVQVNVSKSPSSKLYDLGF